MKIKSQYKVREMAGENVVIMQGKGTSDLTRIISLNESALYLWGEVEGKGRNGRRKNRTRHSQKTG